MSELWQVALTAPPYTTLTYERPGWLPELAPGLRVLAPVRNRLHVGLVLERAEAAPEGVTPRALLWPLEREPVLDAVRLEVAASLAGRQMAPLGRILALALPAGLRSASLRFEVAAEGFPRRLTPRDIAKFHEGDRSRLRRAWEQGAMRPIRLEAERTREAWLRLTKDPPWPVRPNALRQVAVLERLLAGGPQPLATLRRELGPGLAEVVRRLGAAGLVALGEPPAAPGDDLACAEPEPEAAFESSPEQQAALAALTPLLDARTFATALVHGVTGSGKTHVYLELARRCLEAGRDVLLLAPEVALACALFGAVRRRFPERAAVLYHGYQSPARREAAFERLARAREPMLLVGTRSALFAPLRDPGLVVVDEEHDESFKQEDRLAYQAKEVAWVLAKGAGGLLVLGSATPDLKTYHAAVSGGLPLVRLTGRVGGGTLPDVTLADISGLKGHDAPFGPAALEALDQTLAAGDQAVILLNRRGYSPLMYCLDCGQVVRCPECDVAMTYHKARERLVCHYCGKSWGYPMICPGCGGANFLPMGEGTERLEEFLRKRVPREAGVLRLDRDTTRRQERLEEILAAFGRGEAQVLVGTQMLSKGHHFPRVTLALVTDGDLGLNLPDYRAAERSFQLLVQVSGRAGRGGRPGRVVIQTRNPGHAFWNFVIHGDYEGFYRQEIESRRRFGYPPFVKLGLVRLSFPAGWEPGPGRMAQAARLLRERCAPAGVRALGPVPAPLAMLRGRQRFNCLLK
ncbi:MAG: primosomal protein N', partial [Desulfovibrionaceae bacterium]